MFFDTLGNTARGRSAPTQLSFFFQMPIKLKVFIQALQKSQDRHKISFPFEFNNKNNKSLLGKSAPPPRYNYVGFTPRYN